VSRVAMTADGGLFASAGADTHVVVWDARTRKEKFSLKKHLRPVEGLAFSPDGKYLASGGQDYTVHLWDLESREPIATLQGYGPISELCYAPDGKSIALGTGHGMVAIWDTDEPRKLLYTPVRHEKKVIRMAYSPDGKTLASTDETGRLVVWEVATGKVVREMPRADAVVVAFSPAPSAPVLAVGYRDGAIRLLDPVSLNERAVLKGDKGHHGWVQALRYTPDGKLLASGSSDQTVKIWNVSR